MQVLKCEARRQDVLRQSFTAGHKRSESKWQSDLGPVSAHSGILH